MITSPAGSSSESEDARQFPYWRRNLQVMPFANLLCSLGFGICWPFLPLMVRSLGVHEHLETWIGYMMLVFYLIGFIVAPIWGSVADHYGRKIMVLRASLGMGVFMCLVPFAPTPLWFACLFMLVGIFNGFIPASMALLVANTPPKRMGRALALTQTGSLVGQTMGPAVGAMFAAMIDRLHWLFWISGGLLLAGGALVILFVREVKHLVSGPWRPQWIGSLRELLAVRRIAPLYMMSFVFSMLWNGNVTIISIYMLQLLENQHAGAGAEAFWVGGVAMALSVSSVAALPLWGRALDRLGPARVLAFATAAAALTHLPLLLLQTPLQLLLARVAFGLSAAAMQPAIIQLLRIHAPAGMDARAISYASSFQYAGMGLAPLCAGLIGPALGLRAYFALSIVLTLGGLMMWMRSASRRPIKYTE
ncbi:MAG: MFS transporter [Pseudomonadota bacterium]